MIKQWSKYVSSSEELVAAVQILRKINESNYCSFIVGGAVRDIILKASIHDIDLTTDMPIAELEEIFRTHNIGKSKDFGILVVEKNGFNFEISTFRQDGEYSDGRRPETVSAVSSFKEDVLRRDFTINALGLTDNGELIDHVGGLNDIENKIIRTVGDPFERFSEDYVRMIRAARFGSIDGFKIVGETKRAIKEMSSLVSKITPERIRLELVKAASKPGRVLAKFITILEDLTLLKHILPEVSDLKNYPHRLEFHPEGPLVWDHIIKCIEISNKSYLSQLAVMLHDIGKAKTLKFREDGKPQYYSHAKVGSEMVADICDRLKFSSFQKEALIYSTMNHMKWHKILEMKPSKIGRMVDSPYFEILIDVCEADEFSRGEKFMRKGHFKKQLEHALNIKRKWELQQLKRPIRIVDGNRIMELMELNPSKLVGKIKEEVEDYIIDNDIDYEDQKEVDKLIRSVFEEVTENKEINK